MADGEQDSRRPQEVRVAWRVLAAFLAWGCIAFLFLLPAVFIADIESEWQVQRQQADPPPHERGEGVAIVGALTAPGVAILAAWILMGWIDRSAANRTRGLEIAVRVLFAGGFLVAIACGVAFLLTPSWRGAAWFLVGSFLAASLAASGFIVVLLRHPR